MDSYETSEDIVQEVFVHLWQKRKQIKIYGSFKSYLFSSVKNKCIEKLRRKKLEATYISETLYTLKNENQEDKDDIDKIILINKMYNSIEDLPKKCSAIFKMAKFEGLTYTEIAKELDLSVKTIESQMRRAFILLREKLM